MGRGNTCVHGEYEGLYYIDYDNFIATEESEERDYELEQIYYEEDITEILTAVRKMFSSFTPCNAWDGEDHFVLENSLFYIAITDNEWSAAIKLIQKESYYYSIDGLQKRHYQNYLNGIKNVLFNFYPVIGIYGGAWTSGTIKRPDNFVFTI